jgi:glycosyltransferase involved in cell wall biosynthesis
VIAAVATVMNEADIIEASVTHLLEQGVELVLIADASTDGTKDILAGLPVTVIDDTESFHRQPWWIDRLACQAQAAGADWVIPFDADEFWIATDRRTLAEVFAEQPAEVGVLQATMWQHHDFVRRELNPKPLPKVAYRPGGVAVTEGNHAVRGAAGSTVAGLLEVRELQYRSFEHFCRKITERNATIDPALSASHGWHHKRLAGHSVDELREVWDGMMSVPTISDPIW